ncbi:MAG: alpha/beta hydrolase [bacterium]|nr:alpha/beta hydrolase [bacterium]
MPVVKVSGEVEIHYGVSGEGPPLLLISGTGHDRSLWGSQYPVFAREFRCIHFDNRGVPPSSVPPPGYSLADMADDAAAVLDAAGVGKAHVMGFSMGGHIAQQLVLRHPQKVMSLGIHHTWSRNSPRLEAFQSYRKVLAERGDRETLAEISILGLFSHDYYNAHPDEMAKKKKALIESSPPMEGWIGQLDACLKGDVSDQIHKIKVPTLVTASKRDLIVGWHQAVEQHERIAGSKLVILEETGHVALVESPGEFTGICLDFLRSL